MPFLESEVDARHLAGVEQVVALILRVRHAELLAGCTRSADAPEARGFRRPSCRGNRSGSGIRRRSVAYTRRPSSVARMLEDQIDRRELNRRVPKPSSRLFSSGTQSKHHAKFGASSGKVADFLHPLPAPRSGIEERRRRGTVASRRLSQRTPADGLPASRAAASRGAFVSRKKSTPIEERDASMPVGDAPVDEERALVFERRRASRLSAPRLPISPARADAVWISQRARSA